MTIINLPLIRYDVITDGAASKFILYSINGCDLVLDLPADQTVDNSVSSILNQIGVALDAFKAQKHVYKFHRDDDQEPIRDYIYEFSINLAGYSGIFTLSLSEELVGEDAFMLPDRKSWVDEIAEELG